jgi:hypothetical protein
MPVESVGASGPNLMANPEHLELLRQGIDVWNAWRLRAPSVLPNLRGANLTGANLGGASFRQADLSGTNLQTAVIRAANLEQASLYEADLHDADLHGPY